MHREESYRRCLGHIVRQEKFKNSVSPDSLDSEIMTLSGHLVQAKRDVRFWFYKGQKGTADLYF